MSKINVVVAIRRLGYSSLLWSGLLDALVRIRETAESFFFGKVTNVLPQEMLKKCLPNGVILMTKKKIVSNC